MGCCNASSPPPSHELNVNPWTKAEQTSRLSSVYLLTSCMHQPRTCSGARAALDGAFERRRLEASLLTESSSAAADLFASLRKDGLQTVGKLGLDFTMLAYLRHGSTTTRLMRDPDVCLAVRALVPHAGRKGGACRSEACAKPGVSDAGFKPGLKPLPPRVVDSDVRNGQRLLFLVDQPLRVPSCARKSCRDPTTGFLLPARHEHDHGLDADAHGALRHLDDHGWVRVRSWREWGLDIKKLASEAHRALDAAAAAQRAPRYGPKLRFRSSGMGLSKGPGVRSLLVSRPLHDVIHGYLGPSRFDGASALYIGADIETAQYGPGQWHHDRCGRRLKLFVYLSDVNAEAHPTQVASGTHNTVYFSNFSPESRFLDEYVQATHTVVDLTGPYGGGFILDTNAVHRGKMEGASRNRTVVVLEFHPHGKIPPLLMSGSNAPCPSLLRADTKSYPKAKAIRGLAGFELYPQEEPRWPRSLDAMARGLGEAGLLDPIRPAPRSAPRTPKQRLAPGIPRRKRSSRRRDHAGHKH
jgi:hypothetical protein